MHTKNTQHKLIEADRLLEAKFPEPVASEYQEGWNDALQTVYEKGTGLILIKDGDDDGRVY